MLLMWDIAFALLYTALGILVGLLISPWIYASWRK